MATRPAKKKNDPPLRKSEFDHFLKKRFAPLEQDVAILKTDVAGLKTDVAGIESRVARLESDLSLVKRDVRDLSTILQKQHREVMTTLDELVSIYKGSHDKLIVHDQRLGDLEGRVTTLEQK